MSWFGRVSQGPDRQQHGGDPRLTFSRTVSPVRPPESSAVPLWAQLGSGPPPGELPSAPRGAVRPVPPENQAPPGSALAVDPEPISYVTLQEQRCVLSWYRGWTGPQRERFLQDLLGKAVPGKLCTLLDSLSTLQVKDKLPSIFECQLRLWTQWFQSWVEDERNHFLHLLEEHDPVFVSHFYSGVAGTAGRD